MTLFRVALTVLLLSAAPAAAQPLIGDNWDYDRNYDDFDDSLSTVAWTEQSDGLSRMRIQVRCDAFDGLRAMVTFPQYISASSAPVRYRVDDGEIVTETWMAASDDRASLIAPKPDLFAWRLIKGRRLIIEARKDRGGPERLTFKVGGADSEVYRVMRDCGIYDDRLVDDLPIFGNTLGGALDPRKPGETPEAEAPIAKGEPREGGEPRETRDVVGIIGSIFGAGARAVGLGDDDKGDGDEAGSAEEN